MNRSRTLIQDQSIDINYYVRRKSKISRTRTTKLRRLTERRESYEKSISIFIIMSFTGSLQGVVKGEIEEGLEPKMIFSTIWLWRTFIGICFHFSFQSKTNGCPHRSTFSSLSHLTFTATKWPLRYPLLTELALPTFRTRSTTLKTCVVNQESADFSNRSTKSLLSAVLTSP